MLLFLSLVALPCVRGDLPETPYVEYLREAYEEEVARKTASSKRRFVEKLRRLEDEAVAADDLQAAIVLRDRRRPVEAALAILEGGEDADREARAIVLKAESAERRGGVVLDQGKLASWRSGKGEAVWSLRIDPGRYEIELTFSCAAIASAEDNAFPGGTLTFVEDTALVDNGIAFEVLPHGNWDAFRSIVIGEMEFKAANTGVRIRADQVRGDQLMRLKEVRLLPVIPPGAEKAVSELATVAQLEAAFEALLRRRTASLEREYLEALKDLENRAEASDLKERLRAEIQAVTERLADARDGD